ncbi:hypothetical protein SVA_1321 [Sulfurifustis variabilis]|uniref:Uncharacterized protein n=1 Tax=Sulfurifustis variabilis TaxID=1675686 RepID=A0A1B4V2V9_9GAMM|nr:hypothetical protein [Sulfurifustis variabilis]BAU47889.1 hypothetical protein SVA_1321 [Sulfurifustis variabilis]
MKKNNERTLQGLIALNLLASLFHYAHNAVFFDAYPNEPAWLSPGAVDLGWFALSVLAAAAYLAHRRGRRATARFSLLAYTIASLSVIGHYVLAPPRAHTFAMNASILFEAAAALALLGFVAFWPPQRQSEETT